MYSLLYLASHSKDRLKMIQEDVIRLRSLIERNRIEDVFAELKAYVKYSEYQVTVSLLLSNYNEIKQEAIVGLPEEEERMRLLQIKKSLLELLNHLSEDQEEGKEEKQDDIVQITLAKTEEEFKRLLEHKLSSKYTNLQLLSAGDKALIYKADKIDELTSTVQRVAIKVIKPLSVIDNENIDNIKEDLSKAKQLSNFDGMIRIIDEGLDAPPRYIVTEFIDGMRLSQRLAKAWPYKLKEIKSMLYTMGRALQQGHSAGLVHNNIWPSNILVDNDRGPKLSPFQVIRASYYKRTFERIRLFSMYWSPEQINSDSATQLSDQYSFGLVAFELFTGEPFFRGRTIMEILRKRLDFEENPELLEQELKDTLCPPDFVQAIAKMLKSRPRDRFLDMEEVLNAIEDIPATSSFEQKHPEYPLIRRLRNSYNRCRRKEGFYKAFYDYYLDQSPEAREIFDRAWTARIARHNYTEQQIWNYQYRMLDLAVERLLQFPSVSSAMSERLEQLARQHEAVGVSPEEYALFLACLKDTIYTFDENNWPIENDLDIAWDAATKSILEVLTK
jgi:serine/threonine protein kinase